MKMPVNYQVSADNDYSTDEKHRISWKNMDLDGYISSRKLSRKEKKIVNNCPKNHFSKR